MSISLKSIADKVNKHKETLKDLEVQNKEYWLSSLYTLLECPKIIAEHFVSCAQKGLYECRISREWLYRKIKERNNSFDLDVESDEFVLLYLFCLKNIIETYEEKYDILCYGVFCLDGGKYITPGLKVDWKNSETKNKDESNLDSFLRKSLAATFVSFFGMVLFCALGIAFFTILFVVLTMIFLISDIYFALCLLFGNYEVETCANKTQNDIKRFYGIYDAMLTVTKASGLKEVYSRIVDMFGHNINQVEDIKFKVESF